MMIKRLGLSFLLLSFNSFAGSDCVDCGNHIEGFPTVDSISGLNCTDCDCYTETQADAIRASMAERAKSVKSKIQESALENNQKHTRNLSELNRLLSLIPNVDQQKVAEALKNCGLEQIKSSMNSCPGSKNTDHIKNIFGFDSVDAYLGSLANEFEGSRNTASNVSCMTNKEVQKLNENRLLLSLSNQLFTLVKKNKTKLEKKISVNITAVNFDAGDDASLVKIKDILVSFESIPGASAVLRDPSAFQYLVNNIDKFSSNPAKVLDFFEKDAYAISPTIQDSLIAGMGDICGSLSRNVTSFACAGDKLAFANNLEFILANYSYSPSDHFDGFDSLFVNDSGLSFIETNFVSHLYWCASESCSNQNFNNPICKDAKIDSQLNASIDDIVMGNVVNESLNMSLSTFNPNSLCKLADCQGNQTQMNACYEGVKKELGEDADAILLSYSRVTNSSQSSTQNPGANYTPAQTPFAQQFLGSYSTTPAPVATPSQSISTAVPNDPSVEGSDSVGSTSGSSQVTSASTGKRVVTANDAFQQFMNQRFDSLGSSASSFPRTQSNTVSPTTSARVGSNESMSPSERRALDSMNRASQTIEELRDSYRSSALDRMQKMVEQAAVTSTNRSFTNPTVNNSNTNTGSNASSSRARPSSTIRNPSVAATNTSTPANIQTNTTDQTIGGINSNGQNQTTNDRGVASTQGAAGSTSPSVPRVETNNQGQQTLNVNLTELPTINPAKVREEGVDTTKNFNIAVRVDKEVFLVEVRPTFVAGRSILEPMLDNLSSGLKAEVLKSPLFEEYRQYLLGNFVTI